MGITIDCPSWEGQVVAVVVLEVYLEAAVVVVVLMVLLQGDRVVGTIGFDVHVAFSFSCFPRVVFVV